MEQSYLDLKVVRIHRIPGQGMMRAFVDVSINEQILLKGLRIVDGKKGLFVSMPQEKGKDNRWYNSIECLTPDIRRQVQETVLAAFKEE